MANIDIYEVNDTIGYPIVEQPIEQDVALPLVVTTGTSGGDYYKMVALKNPGPGYWVWVSLGAADYTGAGAGGAIQAGTAEVVSRWTIPVNG